MVKTKLKRQKPKFEIPVYGTSRFNEIRHRSNDKQRITLAKNMLVLRQAAGMTQAEVAKRAGVSIAVVTKMEKAEGMPNLSSIMAVASAWNLDAWEILGYTFHKEDFEVVQG